MTINNKFYFDSTVRSLARVLAQIKPTPWEKVSFLINLVSFNWQIDKIDVAKKNDALINCFI